VPLLDFAPLWLKLTHYQNQKLLVYKLSGLIFALRLKKGAERQGRKRLR